MQHIRSVISRSVQELFAVKVTAAITRPDEQFGDYASSIALQLAKQLGLQPRAVAQQLIDAMREPLTGLVQDMTIAGPGFINFRLTDAALIDAVQTKPVEHVMEKRTVLVEYSDPNPFKPLHAGHLYTTLVGDTIARLVERSGAKVIRLNYGGDVGLHVGKAMWAIIKHIGGEKPQALNDVASDQRSVWLGERYVEGNSAYEDDETAKQEIISVNKKVYALHQNADHDSAFAKIYWTCRQWSYDYFSALYAQLEVVPFDRFIPESEVTPLGLQTVQDQLKAGVYESSEGAVIFDGEKHGLHARVFINSAGLPTYETKDVGLLLTKWQDYNFDSSIVITANEQAQYMQVMLKSVTQFAPEPAARSAHLTHGTVKLQGGAKMSSRTGKVVMAVDILEAAQSAANESQLKANESTVLAAVKYAFAKNRIGSDIMYHPSESIALEGNSGPYLQYAHARARSILAKLDEPARPSSSTVFTAAERSLLRKIGEYPEVLESAVAELMPHRLCSYLFELAQSFNRFYEHNRVVGDERQVTRLWLVDVYADVLRDGLTLLGITAPDTM